MENKNASEEIKQEIASCLIGPGEVELISYVPPGLGDVGGKRRGLLMGRETQAETRKQGLSWVLEAEKARPMNSGYDAHMYAVIASDKTGLFLPFVPQGKPGVTRGELLKTTDLLASRSADVNFNDVEIPGSHVVPTMDTCLHSINRAMEIMGAYGADRMWDVEKHWRDIKMGQLYEGGKQLAQMDTARFYFDCKTL